MWFGVISLFPEMFTALDYGITGRAQKNNLIQIEHWNPRDFATDKHKTVDDHPFGGGAGMLMMPEPLEAAIAAAKLAAPQPPKVIFLSPQGKRFDQKGAEELSQTSSIILLAGRYEGIDERVITNLIDEEWSIGDYVLSGGELPAMVMIDTLTRLIPGAVGDEKSISEDSLTSGLLKYPQYTRPENYAGGRVPTVLMSGNHEHIRRWRLKQSLGKTWLRRPDLLDKYTLSPADRLLLNEYIEEFKKLS